MVVVTRNDDQIKQDVETQLEWDHRLDAAGIDVEVVNGEVVLKGAVPSLSISSIASEATGQVAGVRSIENRLEVHKPQPEVPVLAAHETARRAANMFEWTEPLDQQEIDVSCTDGILTLTGSVGALWMKDRAEELARELKGVREVRNQLTVVPTEKDQDDAIARAITAAISRDELIEPDDVTIEVSDGNVHISGTVPTRQAARRAYLCASRTGGVLDVDATLAVASIQH